MSSTVVVLDYMEPGYDQRDVLLWQTGPRSQLSLRQASLNSGRTHVLAENLPQIVGNGRIAAERFPWRTLSHAAASQVSNCDSLGASGLPCRASSAAGSDFTGRPGLATGSTTDTRCSRTPAGCPS